MKFLTARQAAEKLGVTPRRIQDMCRNGKIKGAEHRGREWRVPASVLTKSENSTDDNCIKPANNENINKIRYYSGITELYHTPGSADCIYYPHEHEDIGICQR